MHAPSPPIGARGIADMLGIRATRISAAVPLARTASDVRPVDAVGDPYNAMPGLVDYCYTRAKA